jgi:hypothetical protein
LLSKFDDETKQMVRTLAAEIAREQATQIKHQTIAEMRIQDELQKDAELLPEARQQFALLSADPIWSGMPEAAKNQYAIANAKAVLAERRRTTQQAAQLQSAQQTVNRQQAAGAGLPGTGGAPSLGQNADKETYIKNWMSDPETLRLFKSFERGVDINSPEGQAKLRQYAENAWTPTVFGGAVGVAMKNIEVVSK